MGEYKNKNSLNGEDGNSRYLDFLNKNYKTPDQIEEFYCKYPVLARLIVQKMLDLTLETERMLDNIDLNFQSISNTLKLKSAHITEIHGSQGDTHKRGKSVAKLVLDNGQVFIYKPRNSDIERAFNKFVQYINENSNLMDLYINKVYYAKDFTVESYIETEPCYTLDEVKEFYYRFGEMLALTSLLQGTDFHSENVIAFNKYPVIVDFETLFTQLSFSDEEETEFVLKNKDNDRLNLAATALLPTNAFTNNVDKKGVDVSGLAGGDSVPLPVKMLAIMDLYTDNMRYEYINISKKQDKNKPVLNGEIQSFQSFKHDIYTGFEDILKYIYINRTKIYQIIQQLFTNIEVRQVLKPTAVYNDLLSYMDHPNYSRNMIYLERLLDNNYAYPHRNKKIAFYEIADMHYMEIPIFYTNTSENCLITSTGDKLSNYYKKSALSSVLDNVNHLSIELIDLEKNKLKILLGDYLELINTRMSQMSGSLTVENQFCTKDDILNVCLSIGKKILSNAYFSESKKNISWRHVDVTQKHPSVGFMTNSLYSGRAGVLYFLHYLSLISPENEIKDFTCQLFDCIDFIGEDIEPSVYMGQSSAIWVKAKLNKLKKSDLALVDMLTKLKTPSTAKLNDWLGGTAGFIKLFYDIYQKGIEQNSSLSLTQQYVSDLCHQISNNQVNTENSIGFGHGKIGVVYALLIAEQFLKKDLKKEIYYLLDKIDSELIQFTSDELSNKHSWCHGFGGLGIGALACKKYMKDERFETYIDKSFRVITESDPANMCLCHGLGGDIDFLISMSEQYPDNKYISEVLHRKVSKIVNFYKKNQHVLLNELPGFRDFGMYTGLSGVGFILLRSISPDLVPSALLL
ncbi:type 2 lanthipeptide synthetase LanM family protein [Clostridium sp. BNL1100]|nr:type 2 lanthipeptide synthetase LanM family protein [Clostridium sp. BNL1100]